MHCCWLNLPNGTFWSTTFCPMQARRPAGWELWFGWFGWGFWSWTKPRDFSGFVFGGHESHWITFRKKVMVKCDLPPALDRRFFGGWCWEFLDCCWKSCWKMLKECFMCLTLASPCNLLSKYSEVVSNFRTPQTIPRFWKTQGGVQPESRRSP